MKSNFETWFKARFGNRPVNIKDEAKLEKVAFDGRKASMILTDCALYDMARESAMAAWVAKDLPEAEIVKRCKRP